MSFPLGGLYISKNSKIWKEITFSLRQSLEGVETRRAWACVAPMRCVRGHTRAGGPQSSLETEERCREPSGKRTKGLTSQTDRHAAQCPAVSAARDPCGFSMCCCGKWSEMTCKGCPAWSQEVLNCVRDKDTPHPRPIKRPLGLSSKRLAGSAGTLP